MKFAVDEKFFVQSFVGRSRENEFREMSTLKMQSAVITYVINERNRTFIYFSETIERIK